MTRFWVVACALLLAGTAFAATPEEICQISKNKITGAYAACRQKAEAKAIQKATMPDFSTCDAKFLNDWQKAEAKAAKKAATCVDGIPNATMQGFVAGHTDAVATALAGGGMLSAQCLQPYLTLDESDRNVSFNDGDLGVEVCDVTGSLNPSQSPDWQGAGWYRIAGAAGSVLPESPPSDYSCGTDAPGWLNGAHPALSDGVVTRQVCFSWTGDTCAWSADVEVVSCGSFYLYNLVEAPESCLRYCGE